MSYTHLDGTKGYDYNWSVSSKTQEATYKMIIPTTSTMHFGKKKVATDRSDLRGRTCPACGITRSMNNKCECNS